MDHSKAPSAFSFEGNISKAWKSWKKAFGFFLVATETDGKSENIKTSTLLTCLGAKGRDIYDTFTFVNDEEKMNLHVVLTKFDNYCEPRKNTTIVRHQFLTHKQTAGQTFDEFVIELKKFK